MSLTKKSSSKKAQANKSNFNFYLKKPGAASGKTSRTKFSIYKQIQNQDGSTTNETLSLSDLDNVNSNLAINKITRQQAEKFAQAILKRVKADNLLINPSDEIFNKENESTLEKFLADYFKRKRFLIDRRSAQNKFSRAVRALGAISLHTASEDEIMTHILKQDYDDNKKRDVVAKLNSILKFVGRTDIRLSAPAKPINEITYLTEDELKKIENHEDSESFRSLMVFSFYSGLRIGESFAVSKSTLKADDTLMVESQLDKEGSRRLPKNKKKRRVYLSKKGKEAFLKWAEEKQTLELSRNALTKQFKRLCLKVLKKDCHWHDLRHSYAIYMIGKGVPIQLVAQSMGNSVKVCEEYYSGYILTDIGLQTFKQILGE